MSPNHCLSCQGMQNFSSHWQQAWRSYIQDGGWGFTTTSLRMYDDEHAWSWFAVRIVYLISRHSAHDSYVTWVGHSHIITDGLVAASVSDFAGRACLEKDLERVLWQPSSDCFRTSSFGERCAACSVPTLMSTSAMPTICPLLETSTKTSLSEDSGDFR